MTVAEPDETLPAPDVFDPDVTSDPETDEDNSEDEDEGDAGA
jgi:hypothetical protein